MAIFDEFRQLCVSWDKANDDYNASATKFALRFVEQFASHIGAPTSFRDPIKGSTHQYIEVLKSVVNNVDGTRSFLELDSRLDTLNWDDEGYWHFGLIVRIDPAPNAFPKASVTFFIRFFLQESHCLVKLEPDGTFEVEVDNPETWKLSHNYLVDRLRELFNTKPWDAYNQKRKPGFINFSST